MCADKKPANPTCENVAAMVGDVFKDCDETGASGGSGKNSPVLNVWSQKVWGEAMGDGFKVVVGVDKC